MKGSDTATLLYIIPYQRSLVTSVTRLRSSEQQRIVGKPRSAACLGWVMSSGRRLRPPAKLSRHVDLSLLQAEGTLLLRPHGRPSFCFVLHLLALAMSEYDSLPAPLAGQEYANALICEPSLGICASRVRRWLTTP